MPKENMKYEEFTDCNLVIDCEDGSYEVYFEYEDENINIINTNNYDVAFKFYNNEKKYL